MTNNDSLKEDSKLYKCYLLNVRSHRDYVCLDINSCPSQLNFNNKEDLSLDSSQIVMPVIKKIRFNIKCSNQVQKFWFDDKLEIYAEGHQIYPNNYCTKCQSCGDNELSTSDSSEEEKFITKLLNNNKNNRDFKVGINFENNENFKCRIKDTSEDNLIIKDIINKKNLKSKSEMLTIEPDYSLDCVSASISLPKYLEDVILRKDIIEAAVQTSITLGNADFSSEYFSADASKETLKIMTTNDISLDNTKINNIDDDTKLLNKLKFDKLYNASVNERLKYWNLINRARRVIKLNRNAIELNSLLKSIDPQNLNLINSLSPITILLKLKKINKVSSRMFFNESIEEKWMNIEQECSKKHAKNDNISLKSDFKGTNKESLYIMQKNMLKMMHTFMKNYNQNIPENTSTIK